MQRLAKQIKGQASLFEQDTAINELLPRIDKGASEIAERISMAYPLFKQFFDNTSEALERYRFPLGDVGDAIRDVAQQIAASVSAWIGRIEALEDILSEALSNKDYPLPTPDIELFYQQVGSWLSRAENLLALWERLKIQPADNTVPMACWLKLDDSANGNIDIAINASPVQATDILRDQLWGSCYAAVITSLRHYNHWALLTHLNVRPACWNRRCFCRWLVLLIIIGLLCFRFRVTVLRVTLPMSIRIILLVNFLRLLKKKQGHWCCFLLDIRCNRSTRG